MLNKLLCFWICSLYQRAKNFLKPISQTIFTVHNPNRLMEMYTRRLFACLSLLMFSAALFAQPSTQPDRFPPGLYPDRIILTWKSNPATSIAVTWRTSTEVTKGQAQIALADPGPDFVEKAAKKPAQTETLKSEYGLAHYHSVNIEGLSPNTTYAIRVGDSLRWSEWTHFTTAKAELAPFSFIYFGDAQTELKSLWSRCIREAVLQAPKASFMIHAGDLINNARRDEEWGEWHYAGGWLNFKIPSIATPGNHEYSYRDAQNKVALTPHWRAGFTLPENGPKGLEESCYYVDYQGVRIVSLNTQAYLFFDQDSVSQIQWLEKVLAENPHPWSVVTMHHPVYSSKEGRDNPTIREKLKPIFEKYGVDLVLQGHDHTYGRGGNIPEGKLYADAKGPVYVVSVSGPKMYDISLGDWMYRAASNTQLYQIVQVDAQRIRYEAYTVTNQLYDAFEIRRQGDKKRFVDEAPNLEERVEVPQVFKNLYHDSDWKEFKARYAAYKAKTAAIVRYRKPAKNKK